MKSNSEGTEKMAKENNIENQDKISSSGQVNSEDKELNIVRTLNAPKDLVYKTFIEPSYLERWWGPYNCQKSVVELDPIVGGKISIKMTITGGKEVNLTGEFYEIIENEKIAFTTGPADTSNGAFDVVNLNTVLFEENNGKTNLILNVKMLKAAGVQAKFAFQGMVKGFPESLVKLEELIKELYVQNN